MQSLIAHNLRKLRFALRYRSHTTNNSNPSGLQEAATLNHYCSSSNQGMPSSDVGGGGVHDKLDVKMESKIQSRAPHASKSSAGIWLRWMLWPILSLVLPLWKKRLTNLLRLEDEVEQVAEVVEDTAEVVEMVAEAAEKVSSGLANKLSHDGKLKDAVLLVERVSKEVEKDAQVTIDFIHKVDEIKQEVETLVEPIIDHQKLPGKESHQK